MTSPHDLPTQALRFYASANYPCSYLPDKTARSLVATPSHLVNPSVYSHMIKKGFRRSGLYTYRPFCDHCEACVPVRIPVQQFQSTRSQRRAARQLHDLTVRVEDLTFNPDHYALYLAYQTQRHAGGGMDLDDVGQYQQFFLQSNVDSQLVVFESRSVDPMGAKLKMVTLMDVVDDGLSAVYTFFDPNDSTGLGTAGVIWLIEQARRLNLPYVYLGYWIRASAKMHYKTNFQPQEILSDGVWRTHEMDRHASP